VFELENVRFKNILDIPHLVLDGPVTCITGPSGAGKSTLLRLLDRLLDPDQGRIFYNGADIAGLDPVALRRRVSMLGQTAVLTGGRLDQELQLARTLCGDAPASRQELTRALESVGLDKPLDGYCDAFSGGEKQRVCLARLLISRAATYLLDEPTAALDKATEHLIMENLAQLAETGHRQIIMVTHSPQVMAMFASSLVRLESGHIKEADQ
jgi:putative ABC transport system ATP-binding protein